ncbi:MAG: 3-oxoacyl-ACP reductase [Myxococcales bacterium]|nr:3-oxoacyl-ACP reductase [Myxococcales bacterium]MCB9749213.1 3-oxoacyl-ACP reductase [Myxococcales bacterium]
MNDFLLELGQNPTARKVIKGLGLPLPMPQQLRRARGPWPARPLQDLDVIVGAAGAGPLLPVIATTLTTAGANPLVASGDAALAVFAESGEAYGRPARPIDLEALAVDTSSEHKPGKGKGGGKGDRGPRPHALVFDASDLQGPEDLRALYDFFHPVIRQVTRCGRVVVLGRPPLPGAAPEVAAARAALDGFVRSVAKEIGKHGSTAQLLYVEEGAEARAAGVLRFVLSVHSAFLTGQPLHITTRAAALPPAAAPSSAGAPAWVRALEGKVVLLTGAARGIGAATAKLLADEGAHVVCLDRPQDDALVSRVARDIGGSVLLADVSDPASPERIARELKEAHGGVDVVIHNAGVTRDKTLARMSGDKWDQAVDINLGAVARITRALLEGQVLRDGGRVICLSSVAGIAGNMGQTNYAASKAGVVGYVRSLAVQLAARGITVNAVAPGFIETRLTAAIPVMIREAGRRLSALGQGGLPRDIGDVLTFLATPQAQGLTGSVIRVCGGALIGA